MSFNGQGQSAYVTLI